jgi:hypothetical protein
MMTHSKPVFRERLVNAVRELGVVSAPSIGELKVVVGMDDVSNTQFGRALRSLHYHYKLVHLNRPYTTHMCARPFHVTYVKPA